MTLDASTIQYNGNTKEKKESGRVPIPTLSHFPSYHSQPSSAVSPHTQGAFDETYEVHDPSTLTTDPRRRQQQAASHPAPDPPLNASPRPLSSQGSTRSLRRSTRSIRQRPGSVYASGRPSQIEQTIPVLVQPVSDRTTGVAALRPALSEAQTEDDEDAHSSADDRPRPSGESYWPRRSTRVSPRTASAILWALEEAIRKPLPFTPDWEEVNASMSDLASATSSIGLAGNGRTQNGASRAAQGPVPVNPHPPSGVRTPTDIMRQRRDREARRKAEQEARDREQEEAERRRQESQERAQDPAQPYAAGVAGGRTSQRRAGPSAPAGSEIQPELRASNLPGTSATTQQPPGIPAGSQRPDSQAQPQGPGPQTHPRPPVSSTQPIPQQPPGSAGYQKQQAQPATQPSVSQPQQPPRRVAFPHAFERWETLSSHWEGLTGYWIRKLEQNNEALERDPISQQLARQVTDLSAAGANLFHAVVELQRLRASSERKFQRWFFDTRAEQERSKELQADLERQTRAEKQSRMEAITALQKAESDKARAESLLKEMRRELQISKEEARRAWEELGRREQEERDRTNSLRNGEPTLVGGVQVVPMIQGLPTRQNTSNRPSTRDGTYASGGGGQGKASDGHYYEEAPGSPTETDPFAEGQRPYPESDTQRYAAPQPHSTSAAEVPGQYAGHYYEQEGTYPGRPMSENDNRSYDPSAASSDPGDDEYGGYRRTQPQQGPSIVYSRPMSEESDDYERGSVEDDGGYVPTTMPPTSASGYNQGTVDYSGSGWGVGSTWDSVTPRHRHPTRLSDVMEEEEPRTTPSRASRASRASQASRSVH
ncbi:uncharacterized protein BDW43DRAFT_297986 [Aspergillus alliaceus]|uniref:uncharacterized protein n=1 Tax=Petromyces alliaceus TaxID=209559 RepID=UPI0012A5C536|nr:uncharacterized protein BDW43DRAFT_297986 [Aspergillus alliaceus]KAB8236987.1 hypothetical protein BDW43DRAFT_297986 [Aspergillus alliaceus]